MKWVITENEESLCSGLALEDIPSAVPTNLRILHRGSGFHALAENIAGVISLENDHHLYINPKYANIDPIELLFYIHDCTIMTDNTDAEQYSTGSGEIRIDTLAKIFASELLKIQNRPIKFNRVSTHTISDSIRGRVDWVNTARIQQTGRAGQFSTTVYTPTLIIPENIVISLAARKIIQLFDSSSLQWAVLQKWSSLPIPNELSGKSLAKIRAQMRRQQFSGAHAYYYHSVVLAQAILGFGGVSGGYDYSDNSMIFNMPSLYEEFIRTGFQRNTSSLGLSCQKGFIPRSFLLNNGSCEIIPDITIYQGSKAIALLDVKYKTPDSKDFYQLYAYMKYSGLGDAYIISPSVRDGTTAVAFDGGKIHLVQVASSNPEVVETAVRRILKNAI